MMVAKDIMRRLERLPRAIQWLAWTALFTIAFLVWDSSIAPISLRWSADADEMLDRLRLVAEPRRMKRSTQEAIVGHGPVDLPREKATGAIAMTQAVNAVLGRHAISNDDFSRTRSGVVPRTLLPGIARTRQKIEWIKAELRFDASPEEAAAVIAELEWDPAIESINSLRMSKIEARKVRVRLTLESWVVAQDGVRSRAR